MAEQLKNVFFQKSFYTKLSKEIKKVNPKFDIGKFNKLIFTKEFNDLALKAKMRHTTEALGETLPSDFKRAVDILIKVEDQFRKGFEHLTFSDFVERFGMGNFEVSMRAFEVFTKSSSEFAIRPFIIKYPKRTMVQMVKWSKSDKDYIRRLASEGSRPRLPWAMSLPDFKKDPTPIISILNNLKNDPSEMVRRSVANNLNDISKDNPDFALKIAEKWYGENKEIDKLVKHALRGLLKQGDPRALKLFGFGDTKSIKILRFKIHDSKIKIGGSTKFSFELRVSGNEFQKLRLEYIIDYMKKNGKTSSKVFQLKEGKFTSGKYEFKRKLDFQDRTTRKHYPGRHILCLAVNGKKVKSITFALK